MTTPAAPTTGLDPSSPAPPTAAFGTVFVDQVASVAWRDGRWEAPQLGPLQALSLHPATHALHYGSSCFEGLKAHRGVDGTVRVFRLERHIERLQHSASVLRLPVPDADVLTSMVLDVVRAGLPMVPAPPGSLYLRPTLIGTDPNIGAAAKPSSEALLYVLASPVGDYFAGGVRPLTLLVETELPRTTPRFGVVKTGANYVMALGTALDAAEQFGADQVLFAPDGRVEETGASNIVLVDSTSIVTPALSDSFLHGVTRDSLLRLGADAGYRIDEREVRVDDLLEWSARPDAEVALSGTAAVLSPVGRLIHQGRSVTVGSGQPGPQTARLRTLLAEVHTAVVPDRYGWLTPVSPVTPG
jgi:branched-chain amino acid aminotransferase